MDFRSGLAALFFVLVVSSALASAYGGVDTPALNLTRFPATPVQGDSIVLDARAIDPAGISYIQIVYKIGNGPLLSALCFSSTVCVASTPALNAGTVVYYFARADDASYQHNETTTPLFSVIVSPPLPPANAGNLGVKVTDCSSNTPISGAFVNLGSANQRTGADGSTLFSGIAQGNYGLAASAFGYNSTSTQVFVQGGATTQQAICLNAIGRGSSTPPSISLWRIPSGVVTQNDAVGIYASASSPNPIAWTEVSYSVNSGPFYNVACQSGSCAATAGPYPAGTLVDYTASTADVYGNTANAPLQSYVVTGSATPTPSGSPTPTPSSTPTPSPSPTPTPGPGPTPNPNAGGSCAVFLNNTIIAANESVSVNVSLYNFNALPGFVHVDCGNGIQTNAACTYAPNSTNTTCTAQCVFPNSGIFAVSSTAAGAGCFPASEIVNTPVAPAPNLGALLVQVQDSVTGRALANAQVNLNGSIQYTDAQGQTLYTVANGTYRATATEGGYNSNTVLANVLNGTIQTVVIPLSIAQCDFAITPIESECGGGNNPWTLFYVKNLLPAQNMLHVSYQSPITLNGNFNASFDVLANATLNYSAMLPAGFSGPVAATLTFSGSNPSSTCQQSFTFVLCSGGGLSVTPADAGLTAQPQSRVCTPVTVRNTEAVGTSVTMSSTGAYAADFSESQFYLGAKQEKQINYCINVPSGADGSQTFLINAQSDFPLAQAAVFLTVNGQSSFSVNYTGCSSGGQCQCYPVAPQGNTQLTLYYTNNGVNAGDYFLNGIYNGPGIYTEPVQPLVQNFGIGSTRAVDLSIDTEKPLAGDYNATFTLQTTNGQVVFTHNVCFEVQGLLAAKATLLDNGLVIPQGEVVPIAVAVQNTGNVVETINLNSNSSYITPSSNSITLNPGQSQKVAFNIDTTSAVPGGYVENIVLSIYGAGGFEQATLAVPFEVIAAGAIQQRTILSGLSLKQVGELIIPQTGEVAYPIDVQNNDPYDVNDISVYILGLPPGVTSSVSQPFSLHAFEEKTVFVTIDSNNADQGVVPVTFKADSPTESGAQLVYLRIGNAGVELNVDIAQGPTAYAFVKGSEVTTSFLVKNNEPGTLAVSARIDGLDSQWKVNLNPTFATIAPGATQNFTMVAYSQNAPTKDYNASLVLNAPDGRAKVALFSFSPLQASKVTGFLTLGTTDAIVVGLIAIMLLLAAVFFFAARSNIEEATARREEIG